MQRPQARGVWARLPADTTVLTPVDVDLDVVQRLGAPSTAKVTSLDAATPGERRDSVLLVVRDLTGLRRTLPSLRELGSARRVGCLFTAEVAVLPAVVQRPDWPELQSFTAGRSPECHALAEFAEPVDVGAVVVEMARTASGQHLLIPGWPTLGLPRAQPDLWPPGDPLATLGDPVADSATPPDAFIDGVALPRDPDPVLGRPPADVRLRGRWTALGPLDDRTLNPVGFDRTATGAALKLYRDDEGRLWVGPVRLDSSSGIGDTDLPALRGLPGAYVEWPHHPDQNFCRVAAGLAMCGVPLLSAALPHWARTLLHPELTEALTTKADVGERLDREAHSIRLRRAALRHHAAGPWRAAVAGAGGLDPRPAPTISVVLATRRPERLGFALRQVGRQRGVAVELVLAAHDFDPDARELDAFQRSTGVPLTVVPAHGELRLGSVLNLAVARAAGDLVAKMDDDDWYGRDFLSDLLLARHYSSADIVGCPPEFTFIEPLWLTTRRPEGTERFGSIVAGGTIMIDRSTLRAVGGFRDVAVQEDASLFEAVRAGGGRVYRTHGHGYVLRRGAGGHTWDPGLGYFVSRSRTWNQWHGFRPSPLMDVDAEDLPTRPREAAR